MNTAGNTVNEIAPRGNLLRLLALVVAAWTLRRAALTADSVDR